MNFTQSDVHFHQRINSQIITIHINVKAIFTVYIQLTFRKYFSELIIARIDSMRASDQLLVKCAAILGMSIRKDILEMLLPKAHRPKMSRNIRRLMESGIFQCSKTPTSHLAQLAGGRDEGASIKYRCYCRKEDVVPRSGEIQVCFSPQFMNSLLQQTAYHCLLETQRLELHAKAAHYLEMSADEFRSYIPYYVLARPPPDYLQEALEKTGTFGKLKLHILMDSAMVKYNKFGIVHCIYQGVTGSNSQIKLYFFSRRLFSILANNVQDDEMMHYVVFHLGLHCLPNYTFRSH